MKRFIRWFVDDFTIGFWAGAAYGAWGLTWTFAGVTLAIVVVGGFIKGLVAE